jgi:hypothetical protein
LILVLAVAGCGSQGGSESSTAVNGVAYGVASKVKSGMTQAEVNHLLGRPILTARGTGSSADGCVYYAMQGRPLADLWQFCFDKRKRVSSGATLYSIAQPPPPSDASSGRAALLGRGDTICQTERADLAQPVKRLNRRLTALRRSPNRAGRIRAARLFGTFNDVLTKTLAELSAFDAPPDQRSVLAEYLKALRGQTHILPSAAAALGASQEQRYTQLLNRFNALGGAAKAHALEYGFSTCSGVTFSSSQ